MLYLLLGPDRYAKEQRLSQLLTGPARRVSAEDGIDPWMQLLGQADLFGQAEAIVADGLLSGMKEADGQRLAEYWQQSGIVSADQVVVVLDEVQDLPAKHVLASLLRQGRIEHYAWPSQGQVVRWAEQETARLGVNMEKRLMVELVSVFGANRLALQTELEKLKFMPQPIIELSSVMGLGLSGQAFTFVDLWARKQLDQAMSQLAMLWRENHSPIALIGLIERQARFMYLSLLLHSGDGGGHHALTNLLGVPAFVATKTAKAASHWQQPQLARALIGLHDLDEAIKTGQIEPQLGVELWLLESASS